MSIGTTDLSNLVYDPTRIQKVLLDDMDANGTVSITDTNNPFMMLLEASVMTSSNTALEAINLIRKIHPSLAITPDELYKHLSDVEITGMFATPATAMITFLINTVDLRNNGYKAPGSNYTETTIPKYSEVIVMDTTFTLLNDIIIRYYDEGRVYVESLYNDMEISLNTIGVVTTAFSSDNDGGSWITFDIPMKQVKRLKHSATTIRGDKFKYQQTLTNQYYHTIATYSNSSTGNLPVTLNKTMNEEYINPLSPCVTINLMDTEVMYKIPDVYNISLNVNGAIIIETYETKGNIDLPIHKYPASEFKIIRPDETPDNESKASWSNIVGVCLARLPVSGGSNTMSIEDVRKSIVFKTTGTNELPITRHQLDKRVSYDGFNLFKSKDVITERLFVAAKNLPEPTTALLNARQDLFFNTVELKLDIISGSRFVYLKDDIFIIKSGAIFREVNGIVSLITDTEYNYIKALTDIEKINYFRDSQYFITPYYYIINKEEANTKCRVYTSDSPKLNNLKITTKNTSVKQSVNVSGLNIFKTYNGYRIAFTLVGNDDYKLLDPSKLHGQLSIPIKGSDVNIYFYSNYNYLADNDEDKLLTFDIDTSLFLDSDNYLEITNGVSALRSNFVNILTKATLHLYTYDSALNDDTKYLVSEINSTASSKLTVLTKQTLDIEFGNELEYIYNKMFTSYTDRKYKKHQVDVPMTYEKDVYAKDPVTGRIFTCNPDKTISYNIIHHKGDIVVDEDNNPVYKCRKGDVILDVDGKPVIDTTSGIVRYLDICMFEYIFYVANTTPHLNYNELCLDTVNSWLLTNLPDINSRLLDNTLISFKSYKSCKNIQITSNNVVYSIPYNVKPSITLYTNKLTYSPEETIKIKNDIGKIIHRHLDKEVVYLDNIKSDIKAVLDNNIGGIKISNLDNIGNLETLTLTDKSTRLSINKYIDLTKDNKLIVNYDIDLKFITME